MLVGCVFVWCLVVVGPGVVVVSAAAAAVGDAVAVCVVTVVCAGTALAESAADAVVVVAAVAGISMPSSFLLGAVLPCTSAVGSLHLSSGILVCFWVGYGWWCAPPSTLRAVDMCGRLYCWLRVLLRSLCT